VKCKDESCIFYFKALPKGEGLVPVVNAINLQHSCGEAYFRNEPRSSIPAAFYAKEVKPLCVLSLSCFHFHIHLIVSIDPSVSTSAIQTHFQVNSQISPTHLTSQKARKIAMEDQFGSVDVQYQKLPSLASMIHEADPDASISLDLENSTFVRLFWSYGAAKTFAISQRKLFSVDGGSMSHYPKGTLLTLASEDTENQQVTLAIQITANEESKEELSVFLQNVKNHIPMFDSPLCAVISD